MNQYFQKALGILLGIVALALGISFFVEYMIHIPPCLLCQLQRIPYIATGILSLIGLMTSLKQLVLRLIQLCFLVGVILATYHSFVQFGFLESPCQKNRIEKAGPSWRILGLPPPLYNGVFSLSILIGTEIFLIQTRKKNR